MPKADKKIGSVPTEAVCRSCTTMPVSIRAPPPRRERRHAFPGSQVFGTGTLPVGFQGRSALVAPKGAKSRFKKLVHGAKSLFLCFFAPRTVKMRGRCYISFMIISMSECEEMISAYD